MNKKIIGIILGIVIVVVGVVLLVCGSTYRPSSAGRTKSATNPPVAKHVTGSRVTSRQAKGSRITDADVVGVWINHHNKGIHQKITFTADHKWKENQHHVTNIYSGTWKRTAHNQISLAPYGETIQLYGANFETMNVLNYHHILNKQTN